MNEGVPEVNASVLQQGHSVLVAKATGHLDALQQGMLPRGQVLVTKEQDQFIEGLQDHQLVFNRDILVAKLHIECGKRGHEAFSNISCHLLAWQAFGITCTGDLLEVVIAKGTLGKGESDPGLVAVVVGEQLGEDALPVGLDHRSQVDSCMLLHKVQAARESTLVVRGNGEVDKDDREVVN